jgi:lysylphosphatidylglycerol synthetase-like protein (DUF2156 family)
MMSKQPVGAGTSRDPYARRAAIVRILTNSLLVLLAYELAALLVVAVQLIVAERRPQLPVELPLALAFMTTFLLVRWIIVLPGLLPVLVGLEYVARRAPHAHVVTAIVAFAPMVWWGLTQSSGDASVTTAHLGVTASLFAIVARLPAQFEKRAQKDRGPTLPSAEPIVNSRGSGIAHYALNPALGGKTTLHGIWQVRDGAP